MFVSGLVFGQAAGGEAAKPVGPKLWLESKAIDLGIIAVGQQEIEGVIPYMNDGDLLFILNRLRRCCSYDPSEAWG